MRFNPREYGFTPIAPHTALWRGFWCEYKVLNDRLVLDTLHIYQDRGIPYPPLNGVGPEFSGRDGSMAEYHDLNMTVNYNGSIVLGKDFLQQYYIHMGFQRAWAYKTVIELIFKDGAVVERKDHSDYVAKLREKIDADPQSFKTQLTGDIHKFVEDSFSLEPSVKAWWI